MQGYALAVRCAFRQLIADSKQRLMFQSLSQDFHAFIGILFSCQQHLSLGIIQDILQLPSRERRRERERNGITSKDRQQRYYICLLVF